MGDVLRDLSGRSQYAHAIRIGNAYAKRQNALANGPTSVRRTKIGEMPMPIAPITKAINATDQRCGVMIISFLIVEVKYHRKYNE